MPNSLKSGPKTIDMEDYKYILGHPNHSRGHFAEKNGTRTDIHGHWLQLFGEYSEVILSLPGS